MQGDLFEVAGGKLAIRRNHNKAVLRLAHRLITDHSKSFDDAKAVAVKLGIDVPTMPTESAATQRS